ncbi:MULTISPECIES: septum formation initiator family protein [Anaerococcus]|nr:MULTISPECIES: septum formation initiator family protein [Anaerococcus]MDU0894146.1 septum formation initiator family protein [Anaerococcus sp.]MDU2599481.1 septum formation initiator family protein [Anaerococcus sp.]MDU4025667.1 septum formation initiator family protein [Anaerococcus sp.]MDU5229752.1 septum formation initiator family protein [Anaerococcus sp.]MDU5535254.1 septum formation initiator family protein [Anaerococcus sp.]
MNAEINNLNTEIKSTQKKLDDVNKEITSLENDYEIRNTDQFKEKVAQERLGMVKNSDKKENDQKKAEANKESEQESVDKEISNDDN